MLHRLVRVHEKSNHDSEKQVSIPTDRNKGIIYAVAKAAAIDTLPLTFYEKKIGMQSLAQSLIELGQIYSPSCSINVANILPCGITVTQGIIELALIINSMFKSTLVEVFHCGG